MKFLILFEIISLAVVIGANSFPDTTSTASYFCDMSDKCWMGESIACSYTSDVSIRCDGEMVPMDINLILSAHNNYRQKIAAGEYGPQYESATNIYEMTYSDELEMIASYNARTCNFAHDECRSTNNFPYSGQNIAYVKKWNSNIDFAVELTGMIDRWFDEYEDGDMSYINSYYVSNVTVGHFTQIVKDKAIQVGCAGSNYIEDDVWNVFYVVCNYAYGNMLYEPIYVAGPPGDACVSRSTQYPDLCAP